MIYSSSSCSLTHFQDVKRLLQRSGGGDGDGGDEGGMERSSLVSLEMKRRFHSELFESSYTGSRSFGTRRILEDDFEVC